LFFLKPPSLGGLVKQGRGLFFKPQKKGARERGQHFKRGGRRPGGGALTLYRFCFPAGHSSLLGGGQAPKWSISGKGEKNGLPNFQGGAWRIFKQRFTFTPPADSRPNQRGWGRYCIQRCQSKNSFKPCYFEGRSFPIVAGKKKNIFNLGRFASGPAPNPFGASR